jgi:hypothetical protein
MKRLKRSSYSLILFICLTCLPLLLINPSVSATIFLLSRTDQLSDSYPGNTATNVVGFQIAGTNADLGSVQILFCSNSPLVTEPCTAPTGLDASGTVLNVQSGNTGFSISGLSNANTVILTRPPSPGNNLDNSYELDNIVNPSTLGTYYVRLTVYPTSDASGPYTVGGGVALSTTSNLSVNSIVPPFLEFCSAITIVNQDCASTSGNYVDLSSLSTAQTSSGTSEFTVATNAKNGYGVTVQGDTLRSGIIAIPPLSSPTVSLIGVSQFGLNLRTNSVPPVGGDPFGAGGSGIIAASYNIPNQYTFNSGDIILSSSGVSNFETYEVSYIANINTNQAPGFYVTTISYICLANF